LGNFFTFRNIQTPNAKHQMMAIGICHLSFVIWNLPISSPKFLIFYSGELKTEIFNQALKEFFERFY